VFERDNWTCHLCGGAVDPDLPRLDPMGATIDHLTPLSLGGVDELANVATAHWSCNRAKGNRVAVA
jgi:5-methylcytosine-specific restriction endonuclease McrA